MSNYTKQNSLGSKEFDDAEEYVVFSPTAARPVLHIPNKSNTTKDIKDKSKKQNDNIVDTQPNIVNTISSEILSDAIYSGLKESTLDIGFKKETIAKIIKLVIEAVELSKFNGEEAKLYSLKILKALIHDCASFMAEYMVTRKPLLYVSNMNENNSGFNRFGNLLYEQHYKASAETEIKDFIENVVINGNDRLKDDRFDFIKEFLIDNEQTSSERIYKDILNKLN